MQKRKIELGSKLRQIHNFFRKNQEKSKFEKLTFFQKSKKNLYFQVGCFQHLKFFLCTMYTPICQENYDKPILPCMELCVEARSKCSPIMAKYGFRWPETLSCEALPKMSDQMSTGNICAAPPDTPKKQHKGHHHKNQNQNQNQNHNYSPDGPEVGISKIDNEVIAGPSECQCTCNQPFQFVASEKSKVGNVTNCAYSCHSPALAESHSLVSNWMAFWSITCCVLASFTFLTFLIETDRFQYPERPIFMLAFCQLMVAVGFMIRYFVGHEEIACDSMRIKGADDNSGSLCFVVFLLTYFFGMAASVWWVILSLTWVLSAASKWSPEAISSFSFHFHVVGWCLPAIQTVLVIVFNAIDGDPITGICYVGNTDLQFQRIFVLFPLLVYFIVGVLFLVIGFCNLWSIRNEVQKQHPSLESAHKITQLMSKIGIFSLLYTIPSLLIICVLFYEQNHRSLWEQSQLCSCSPKQTIGEFFFKL